MDAINDRWGEFVVTPALMLGMKNIILDRISFGGVKDVQEIYQSRKCQLAHLTDVAEYDYL
jgi:hypothetical protein